MKSNLDKFFKVDEAHAEKGVVFQIDDKTSFTVRHFAATNPRVKASLANYYKPYARQIELGTLDDATQIKIRIKIFVAISLVDWKGVEIDGKPAECNDENALKLFTGLPNLFEALWAHANDFNNYKEDLGNS